MFYYDVQLYVRFYFFCFIMLKKSILLFICMKVILLKLYLVYQYVIIVDIKRNKEK